MAVMKCAECGNPIPNGGYSIMYGESKGWRCKECFWAERERESAGWLAISKTLPF